MEDIIESAKKAGMHDFIKSLYLGYNHVIGEFGRAQVVRCLRLDSAAFFCAIRTLIVLDEAGSMLDLETETRILTEVHRHFSGKTIISIAHRLHTLLNSDKIVVIDEGTVVEQGTHDNLMEANGIYHKLMSQYVNY